MMSTDNNNRLLNTTTCFPIAYGSIAFYLGKSSTTQQQPVDDYKTHRWTLYVRHPDPTYDLSRAISKVIFQLHPSFPQPMREIPSPPFEVTECGWGEFEASIRIFWKEESDERPVLVTHGIKLYPNHAPATLNVDPSTYMNTAVPVVSEKYDEVVFTNPKIAFHKLLLDGDGGGGSSSFQLTQKKKKKHRLPYPLSNEPLVIEHFRTYGDESDVKAMLAAKEFLQKELRNVKDRLIKVDEELEEVKQDILLATTTGTTTVNTNTTTTAATPSLTAPLGSATDGTVAAATGAIEEGGGSKSSSTEVASAAASATRTGKVSSSSSSKSEKKKKKAVASAAAGGSSSSEPPAKKAK